MESTYFLYKATEDPHYLEVGKKALKALQKYARVPCGFATIKDVRTLQKEDRMDSFVLAETFKYLYLLFANDSELLIDVNDFVFTTEAHLLPLSLARLSNKTAVPVSYLVLIFQSKMYYSCMIFSFQLRSGSSDAYDEDVEFARSCPSTEYLFPHKPASFVQELRTPLANIVNEKCPVKKIINRKLFAADFKSGDVKHMALIKNMGINLVSLPDGRVQLMHTHANVIIDLNSFCLAL